MNKIKCMSLVLESVRKIEWFKSICLFWNILKPNTKKLHLSKASLSGSCLHLEPKTINLGLTLMADGAEVAMTCCNPISTHDDAVEGTADLGINVYGCREPDDEEY